MPDDRQSFSCPICLAENEQDASTCRLCKAPLEKESGVERVSTALTRTCSRCSTVNFFAARDCSRCGVRLGDTDPLPGSPTLPLPTPPIGKLVLLTRRGEGGCHLLPGPDTIVGCNSGPIFHRDPYLTPQHVRFSMAGESMVIEEVDRLSGILLRIHHEELHTGDVFRIGRELIRFEKDAPATGRWGRLTPIAGSFDDDDRTYFLRGESCVVGRTQGDIQFPKDPYLSRLHAKLSCTESGEVMLDDLRSREGTFLRLRQPRAVKFGAQVLIGQQLFRIDEP